MNLTLTDVALCKGHSILLSLKIHAGVIQVAFRHVLSPSVHYLLHLQLVLVDEQ